MPWKWSQQREQLLTYYMKTSQIDEDCDLSCHIVSKTLSRISRHTFESNSTVRYLKSRIITRYVLTMIW
jgi:hypothetical protein